MLLQTLLSECECFQECPCFHVSLCICVHFWMYACVHAWMHLQMNPRAAENVASLLTLLVAGYVLCVSVWLCVCVRVCVCVSE
jgi:putative exporter of polyketide antibiotics